MSRRHPAALAVALLLAGCAAGRLGDAPAPSGSVPSGSAAPGSAAPMPAGTVIPLFAAAASLADGWQHVVLRGATGWRLAAIDGIVAIRAEGNRSASGQFRHLEADDPDCTTTGLLTLRWRVDAAQPSADLTVRGGDDVAAGLYLLFGDPGLLSNPRPVPTLRYVWTGDDLPVGTVVDSPYLPGIVRSIVLRNADTPVGTWYQERRDIAADFAAAFGTPPPEPIQAVALFADNDQTQEPVIAYFDRASIACTAG